MYRICTQSFLTPSLQTDTALKYTENFRIPMWILLPVVKLGAYPPNEGAYTSLFAATSTVIKADKRRYAGAYLTPFGAIAQPSKEARDPVAARNLWETTERVVSEL